MKHVRILAFCLSILMLSSVLFACTGDVPPPYESDEVLAAATVHVKVVVQDDETDEISDTLLDKDILVTSSKMPAVTIRDLINTMIGEENHIYGKLKYNREISVLGNYEANDTHMWFWTLDGNETAINTMIKDDNTIIFTYAEKSAELKGNTGNQGGRVTTLTNTVVILVDGAEVYHEDYVVNDLRSQYVRDLCKRMQEEKILSFAGAQRLESLTIGESEYANEEGGRYWKVYVNKLETLEEDANSYNKDFAAKFASGVLKDGDTLYLVFDSKGEATPIVNDAPEVEPDESETPAEGAEGEIA